MNSGGNNGEDLQSTTGFLNQYNSAGLPLETLKEDKRDDDNATPLNDSEFGNAGADSSQAALRQ